MKLHYTDEIIREYSSGLDALYEKMQLEEKKLFPAVVYHYTKHEGLLGILESKMLWVTDTGFVNDTKEMAHGSDILSNLIEEQVQATSDKMLKFLWKNIALVFKDAHTLFDMYVLSFCESPDQELPVWTMYADDGNGFNIGLRKSFFERLLDPRIKRKLLGWVVGKVNYRPDDIAQRVKDLCVITNKSILSFLKSGTTNASDANKVFRRISANLVVKLLPEICLLKHPHYKFEKEFRIVAISRKDSINGLIHLNGSKPYICSEPFVSSEIEDIWLGPSQGDDMKTREGIRQELISISDEYRNIPIRHSSISYRSFKTL